MYGFHGLDSIASAKVGFLILIAVRGNWEILPMHNDQALSSPSGSPTAMMEKVEEHSRVQGKTAPEGDLTHFDFCWRESIPRGAGET